MPHDAVKNLDHLLISDTDTVPSFTILGTTYEVFPKIPAPAYVKLLQLGGGAGMRDFLTECIVSPTQKAEFLEKVYPRLDLQGLDDLVREVIESVTPFDQKKSSAS